MKRFALSVILGASFVLAVYTAPASAQATRTWVSGVGDDANPCSRTAPCKTFAGAISKTAAGGEINCLDPGGFGGVTITKSLTIDCHTTVGGVLVAGTNAVVINLATAIVTLRGLDFEGAGTGLNGINVVSAAKVYVQQSHIRNFRGSATSAGILFAPSGTGYLEVTDTIITDCPKGIRITNAGAGFSSAAIKNVQILGTTVSGVELASNNTFAAVRSSTFANILGGSAVLTTGSTNATISVEDSAILNSSTAFNAGSSGSKINIARNTIFGNTTAYTIAAGATIATANNNTTSNNGGATIPNGVIVQQ